MSELRKANTYYPYFLTLTTVGWIDIFTRRTYCDWALDSLKHCIQYKDLEVFANVIMPSHLHLVVRNIHSRLPDIIRDLKRHVARSIISDLHKSKMESRRAWLLHMFKYHAKYLRQNEKFKFWQNTSHPIELSYAYILNQKVEYIHMNPVAAGHVTDETTWTYSSANPFQTLPLAKL